MDEYNKKLEYAKKPETAAKKRKVRNVQKNMWCFLIKSDTIKKNIILGGADMPRRKKWRIYL